MSALPTSARKRIASLLADSERLASILAGIRRGKGGVLKELATMFATSRGTVYNVLCERGLHIVGTAGRGYQIVPFASGARYDPPQPTPKTVPLADAITTQPGDRN